MHFINHLQYIHCTGHEVLLLISGRKVYLNIHLHIVPKGQGDVSALAEILDTRQVPT